jgi:hypothetical protein
MSSPGNSYLESSSRTSISTRSSSSASSTMSHLFMKTTRAGTPTWRASRMCSRVWGIGPSAAEHHQDRAVHLGGAGDHVFHVVGVAGAVDVRVVAVVGLVFDVGGVDGDPARFFFRGGVDVIVFLRLGVALLGQGGGDRGGEGGFAVVNVTDGPDVDVRLVPLE